MQPYLAGRSLPDGLRSRRPALRSTRVEHPAQLAFDALSGLADRPGDRNVLDLAKDAALRERLIQSQVIRCASGLREQSQAKSDVAGLQDESPR